MGGLRLRETIPYLSPIFLGLECSPARLGPRAHAAWRIEAPSARSSAPGRRL